MLLTRIITAAVAVAILFPALIWGQVEGLAVLVAVCSGIAVWELSRSLPGLKGFPRPQLTLLLGLAIVAAFYVFPVQGNPGGSRLVPACRGLTAPASLQCY